jgi:outer membrane protein OmpA-like peptidoglycan-associated protein
MKESLNTLVVTLMLCLVGGSNVAQAQIWKRIKEQAVAKVTTQKAKTDSTITTAAGKAVDSSLAKTGRGADAVVNKTGSLVDTALNVTERGVANAVSRKDGSAEKLAADLKNGRAVIWDITFVTGGDDLEPSSANAVSWLAAALNESGGAAILLEVHVDSGKDVASDQELSDRRAKMLKAKLVPLGVKTPIFALGQGSSRPSQNAAHQGNARVEVSKAQ